MKSELFTYMTAYRKHSSMKHSSFDVDPQVSWDIGRFILMSPVQARLVVFAVIDREFFR